MRYLILFILFVLNFQFELCEAQTVRDVASVSRQSVKQKKTDELEISASITRQEFCSERVLRLSLRLTYQNIGTHTIILSKYSDTIYQSSVSKTIKALNSKRYETSFSPWVQTFLTIPPESPPNMEYFTFIEPGQSLTFEDIRIPVFLKSKGYQDGINKGQHFLQIQVKTFPATNISSAKLRDNWQQFGYLWSNNLTSGPIVFEVAPYKNRIAKICS